MLPLDEVAAELPSDISDDEVLYRRIPPSGGAQHGVVLLGTFLKLDKATQKRMPDPRLSVDRAKLSKPEETARRAPRPGYGVAQFTAGVARAMGLNVRPEPHYDNPAHAIVEGLSTRDGCDQLAEACGRPLIMPDPTAPKAWPA